MSRSRLTRLAALLLPVVFLLDGCSGNPSGSASQSLQLGVTTLTCDQYASLTEAQKKQVYDDTKRAWFGPQGASYLTEREVTETACATGNALGTLRDVYERAFTGQTELLSDLDCTTFLHLSGDAAKQWADVLAADVSDKNYTVPIITSSCNKYPSLKLYKGMQIESTLTDKQALVWTTESKLGFITGNSVKVSALQKEPGTYPNNGTPVKVGDSCGFTAGKDAAIPVTITAINLTAEKHIVTAGWSLEQAVGAGMTVSADVETLFSDGVKCDSENVSNGSLGAVSVQWSSGTEGLTTAGITQSYIILHNYYSPRYPNGATQDLVKLTIHPGTGGGTTDDPVTITSNQGRRITLAGQNI